ncbi:MAG: hypothetical protein ACRDT6_15100 [Micromonosporaceae bacterium]
MRTPRLLVLVLTAVALAGCGPSGPPSATTSPSRATPAGSAAPDERQGAPLRAFPTCGPAPTAGPATARDAVKGLVLPPGTVITGSTAQGKTLNISGYVALTPVRIRQFYEKRTELKFFTIEDEVFEAEVFFQQPDGKRAYVKAKPACRTASRLVIVIAPGASPG